MTTTTDAEVIAGLDIEYQAAVKNNDAATMDRLLADDFVLIDGNGTMYDKADLLREAREEVCLYERQDATDRTVRCWGDTAVVTALLWVKGTRRGEPFNFKGWFSDTYVRTAGNCRCCCERTGCPVSSFRLVLRNVGEVDEQYNYPNNRFRKCPWRYHSLDS
jgi:ketosteroid isomerase-like protein